mgnify:CR=1 FL=1
MDALSRMPCIVCLLHYNADTPGEVHHIVEGGRRMGHKYTFTLCNLHHGAGVRNDSVVSRHPYKAEFERRYGSEYYLLEETNKRINEYK